MPLLIPLHPPRVQTGINWFKLGTVESAASKAFSCVAEPVELIPFHTMTEGGGSLPPIIFGHPYYSFLR